MLLDQIKYLLADTVPTVLRDNPLLPTCSKFPSSVLAVSSLVREFVFQA